MGFGKDLSRTLNADECVARGCALQAAILSPVYKVRDFKVEDKVPHGVTITWLGTNKDAVEADAGDKDEVMESGETTEEAKNMVQKSMEVFNADKDKMDSRRYITWYRNGPFDLGAQYSSSQQKIGEYKIQLGEQPEKKKIKIEAKMNIHGIFSVDNAHIVETEEYEETTKEKREVKDEDGDTPMPDANGAEKPKEESASTNGDTAAGD